MSSNSSNLAFRDYEICFNVFALEEYIKILEVELPHIIERERQRIWKGVVRDDKQQCYYAENAELELDQGVAIRHLTDAALVAIWATYEAAVKRTAKRFQRARKLERGLSDRKGSFPTKARDYFESVLHFELHPPATDWTRLDVL